MAAAGHSRGGRGGVMSIAPWLTCAVIAWLLTGLTCDEWLAFAACLVAASPVYLATSALRSPRLACMPLPLSSGRAPSAKGLVAV